MKILFYINSTHEDGGAERVITNLASYFSQNHETVLVTSFPSEWEYPVSNQVKRVNLFPERLNGKLNRNFKLIRELRKCIKDYLPDVVVSFMGEPNFRSCIAKIGLRTKLIVSVRNDPITEYPGLLGKVTAKLLMPLFADGCVFQTEDAKKWFPNRLQMKSKIIFNSVNSGFFECKYSGVRKNIVACGRLTEQKNHRLLIESFNIIKDQIDDNLLIYGEGHLREDLEKLIEELHLESRVFLKGKTDNVIESIKDARLFVLSSNYEGMPNALMEAMTLGIPCISTDCPCGGPRMIINNGVNGFLVPVKDGVALSNTIIHALNEADLESLSINSVNTSKEMFDSARINKEWENYFYQTWR